MPLLSNQIFSHVRPCWQVVWISMLCVFISSAYARYQLEPDMPVTFPSGQVSLLERATELKNTAAVLSGELDASFKPLDSGRTSMGVTKSVWWVRFEAVNSTEKPIEWVVNFPFAITDTLDFYCMTDGQITSSYQLGDKRPLSDRPLPGEGFAIPIDTPAGKTTTVYVRMQNIQGDGIDTYFEVSSVGAYYHNQLKVWLFLGAVVGGIVVLFLYNGFLFLVVRDKNYLWYLSYLICAFSTFIGVSGLGGHFLWSYESLLTELVPPLFSSLTFIFVIQFSRCFLDTQHHTPRMDKLLRWLMVYFVIPPFAFLFNHSSLAAEMIMVGCIGLSMLPLLSAYIWRQGHRAALIFTMGWGLWFLSIGLMAGRILGAVPSNDFTLRIGWAGILGEAVLFALALAYRIRNLQSDKVAAEEREREALERSKEELEALVVARTQELATRNEQLRVTNSEKDKFFSIIAHDLRNPFNGVIGFAELLSVGIHEMSREEVDRALRDLRFSASNLYKLLENLLAWAVLQRGGFRYEPELIDLDTIIDQCVAVYQQAAQQKRIQIKRTGQSGIRLNADSHMLATVIRNLLSNAIKYSYPGAAVIVHCEQEADDVLLSVQDSGVGMDSETLSRLFVLSEKKSSPGTNDESGTGLGLQLCKELVQAQGGTLKVESQRGLGSAFTVRLNA